MKVYYLVTNRGDIIPAYLIKQGYIPAQHYREDVNDEYYKDKKRKEYCIDKKKCVAYKTTEEAKPVALGQVENFFNEQIRKLMDFRTKQIETINKYKN